MLRATHNGPTTLCNRLQLADVCARILYSNYYIKFSIKLQWIDCLMSETDTVIVLLQCESPGCVGCAAS